MIYGFLGHIPFRVGVSFVEQWSFFLQDHIFLVVFKFSKA